MTSPEEKAREVIGVVAPNIYFHDDDPIVLSYKQYDRLIKRVAQALREALPERPSELEVLEETQSFANQVAQITNSHFRKEEAYASFRAGARWAIAKIYGEEK